jgi:hypothetical protein
MRNKFYPKYNTLGLKPLFQSFAEGETKKEEQMEFKIT